MTLEQVSAVGTPLRLPDPPPSITGTLPANAAIISTPSNSVTVVIVTQNGFEVVVSSALSSMRELVSTTFGFQAGQRNAA